MNFHRAWSKALAVGLLALSAQGASALFVANGSTAFGKHSLVADTTSGLTWLNLDVTAGLSFNAVAGLLEQDARYDNFRFASLAEITTLFTNAGFSVDIPTGNLTDADRLTANASFARAFVGPRSKGTETFRGYSGEPGLAIDPEHGVYSLQVAGVGVKTGAKSAATAFTDAVTFFSSEAYAGVGSWLVYDPSPALQPQALVRTPTLAAVTPVPEPSTYALMLAGLITLAWATRRARSRPATPSAT